MNLGKQANVHVSLDWDNVGYGEKVGTFSGHQEIRMEVEELLITFELNVNVYIKEDPQTFSDPSSIVKEDKNIEVTTLECFDPVTGRELFLVKKNINEIINQIIKNLSYD